MYSPDHGSSGLVLPDGVDDAPDAVAPAVAPEEVIAGGLDEELVLAGRDGRRVRATRTRASGGVEGGRVRGGSC